MTHLTLEVSDHVVYPEIGKKFWTYYKNSSSGFSQVIQATYDGGLVDIKRVESGRVYKTQSEAKKASLL